jgi:hypothetical protein
MEGILIYFSLGILNDILVTLYYILINKGNAIFASFTTFLITLLNFFVIGKIVVSTNWILILTYSLGCAIGCFVIVKLNKKIK